ncbi:MAG TPA: DNA oxidative demethylase AlkB [Steroidobacteraceae bacterium]|nr:DNA oxidative demethylase AlkB [Steroidobacteraceae bacterium]
MSRQRGAVIGDLADAATAQPRAPEALADGAVVLRRFASAHEQELLECVRLVTAAAPFRNMVTPGGCRMSVAMTNCGPVGWVTDRTGYRYDPLDPRTGRAWPPLPESLRTLAVGAAQSAGFAGFVPDACLINRYEPGTRLSMHQDRNERDFHAPVVSISLGLPATFLFGGQRRAERPQRVRLVSGDVVAWGGKSRLAFHGVAPLDDGEHPLTGRCRFNFTLRAAL